MFCGFFPGFPVVFPPFRTATARPGPVFSHLATTEEHLLADGQGQGRKPIASNGWLNHG